MSMMTTSSASGRVGNLSTSSANGRGKGFVRNRSMVRSKHAAHKKQPARAPASPEQVDLAVPFAYPPGHFTESGVPGPPGSFTQFYAAQGQGVQQPVALSADEIKSMTDQCEKLRSNWLCHVDSDLLNTISYKKYLKAALDVRQHQPELQNQILSLVDSLTFPEPFYPTSDQKQVLIQIIGSLQARYPQSKFDESFVTFVASIHAIVEEAHRTFQNVVLMYDQWKLGDYSEHADGKSCTEIKAISEDTKCVLEFLSLHLSSIVDKFEECNAMELLVNNISGWLKSLLTWSFRGSLESWHGYTELLQHLLSASPCKEDPRYRLRYIVACIIGRHVKEFREAQDAERLESVLIQIRKSLIVDRPLLRIIEENFESPQGEALTAAAIVPYTASIGWMCGSSIAVGPQAAIACGVLGMGAGIGAVVAASAYVGLQQILNATGYKNLDPEEYIDIELRKLKEEANRKLKEEEANARAELKIPPPPPADVPLRQDSDGEDSSEEEDIYNDILCDKQINELYNAINGVEADSPNWESWDPSLGMQYAAGSMGHLHEQWPHTFDVTGSSMASSAGEPPAGPLRVGLQGRGASNFQTAATVEAQSAARVSQLIQRSQVSKLFAQQVSGMEAGPTLPGRFPNRGAPGPPGPPGPPGLARTSSPEASYMPERARSPARSFMPEAQASSPARPFAPGRSSLPQRAGRTFAIPGPPGLDLPQSPAQNFGSQAQGLNVAQSPVHSFSRARSPGSPVRNFTNRVSAARSPAPPARNFANRGSFERASAALDAHVMQRATFARQPEVLPTMAEPMRPGLLTTSSTARGAQANQRNIEPTTTELQPEAYWWSQQNPDQAWPRSWPDPTVQ